MTRPAVAVLREQARVHVLEAQRLVNEAIAVLGKEPDGLERDEEFAQWCLHDAASYLEPEAPTLRVVGGKEARP
jgi:hypothetical protein